MRPLAAIHCQGAPTRRVSLNALGPGCSAAKATVPLSRSPHAFPCTSRACSATHLPSGFKPTCPTNLLRQTHYTSQRGHRKKTSALKVHTPGRGPRPHTPATVALPRRPHTFCLVRFPLGNFAENQLVGRSISLSPLDPPHENELHVSTPTPLHPRFDGLQAGQAQFTCPSGHTRSAPTHVHPTFKPRPTPHADSTKKKKGPRSLLSLRHRPSCLRLAEHVHSLTSVSRRAAHHSPQHTVHRPHHRAQKGPTGPPHSARSRPQRALAPQPVQVFELPLEGPFQLSLTLLGSLSVTPPSLALRGDVLAIQRPIPKSPTVQSGPNEHIQPTGTGLTPTMAPRSSGPAHQFERKDMLTKRTTPHGAPNPTPNFKKPEPAPSPSAQTASLAATEVLAVAFFSSAYRDASRQRVTRPAAVL